MIVTSTDSVPGAETAEVLGLARRNTVRARNIGRDITQGLRNLAGGELKAYSSLLSESHDQALSRMKEEASELGADAVVNVRFETAQVTDGGAKILAYGTAIRLE